MKIKQFEDKNLSHYSYAILSECERKVVLIDPARNPEPYYDFAKQNEAEIIAVIETHPHADFVSSHLEIHRKTGAKIYASKIMKAGFPVMEFDEGSVLEFGKIKLKSLNTPGHSPDSISIVLEHKGKNKAVFTGDTLFIGDCGRPDLRESDGDVNSQQKELAKKMYSSLRDKLIKLEDKVKVYPAHGAGTLCGKSLSEAHSSTIMAEKFSNWSLQQMSEAQFVKELTSDQPFIPKYFPYNVDLNKKGAPNLSDALDKIVIGRSVINLESASRLDPNVIIVDTRPAEQFKSSHLPNAINLMNGEKFETWLGSIISPGELFYLAGANQKLLDELINRAAEIGYETFIKEAFVLDFGVIPSDRLNVEAFKENLSSYTIVDVRNRTEVKDQAIFKNAINIPLPELRNRINEIPNEKPIVVHCAGGYRSAAGSSIIESKADTKVFDLSDQIKDFQ